MKVIAILCAALGCGSLAFPTDVSADQVLPNLHHQDLSGLPKTPASCNTRECPTYNEIRAGSVLSGEGFDNLLGTIEIPPLRLPPGGKEEGLYGVSTWIGMDGESTCPKAYIRVGIDMFLNNSVPVYWAWFGWYPGRVHYVQDFEIEEGDVVAMNIRAFNLSYAEPALGNRRSGQWARARLTEEPTLFCGFSVQWMVQDMWKSDGVPLVDFGTIEITDAVGTTNNAVRVSAEDGELEAVREYHDVGVVIGCRKKGREILECDYRGGSHP